MKYKIVLFFLTFVVWRCQGQNPACPIADPEGTIDWASKILRDEISDVGTLNLVFSFEGALTVIPNPAEPDAKYLEILTQDSTIIIRTTDDYTNSFEEDQKNVAPTPQISISRTVSIICEGDAGTSLNINIYVADTNNHPPVFLSPEYTMTMPMPLVPKVDLTSFDDQVEIFVEDLDFSNTDITFTVDPPEHFAVTTQQVLGSPRQYRAVLKVTDFVRFDDGLTLTITATDNKEPLQSGTATINIAKDGSASIPDVPTFSDVLYTFQYSDNSGTPTIAASDGKAINIVTSDPSQTTVTQSGEETYVKVDYVQASNTVTISSTGTPIEASTESVLSLTLTVSLGTENSQSVILINLPVESQVTVPTFSAPYYTATYSTSSDPHNVTLDAGQVISATENAEVTLQDTTNFSVDLVDGTYQLSVKTNLDATTLKEESEVVLNLQAKVTDGNSQDHIGNTYIVVKLPAVPEIPKFSQAHYNADFQSALDSFGTVIIQDGPIAATSGGETVDISLETSDLFDLTNNGGTWTVNVIAAIPDPDLKSGKEYVLTLQAVVSGSSVDAGTATLIITVPAPPPLGVPKFTKNQYFGDFQSGTGDHGSVNLENGPIDATSGSETVEIALETNEYFEILNDAGVWTVNVIADLPPEDLQNGNEYVLTLQATIQDNTDVEAGVGTLIIRVPAAAAVEIPKFTHAYYTATYMVDASQADTIALINGPIATDTQGVTVTFEETDYLQYFSIDYDTANDNYQLNVKADLPPEVVNQGNVILTLDATVQDSSNIGSALLVIIIQFPETPTFSKTYYTARYTVDENQLPGVTVTGAPITITSPQDQTVSINFAEVTDYFSIALNPDNQNEWLIGVVKNLPDDVLESGDPQVLTLQAITAGASSDNVGKGTLIIEFEKLTTPKFLKAYYNGEYTVDVDGHGAVTISDGPIQLSATAAVNIALTDPYATYFDFAIDANPQFSVVMELDESIISANQEILLTLEVSLEGTTDTETTIVALKLPYVETTKTLKFSQPSYIFSYVVNGNSPSIDQKGQTISLANGETGVAVNINTGPYSNNFMMILNPDDGTYSIAIAPPLDQTVLDSELDILLVLDASLSGEDDGFATVLINLPKKDAGIAPQFTQASYSAIYTIGQESGGSRTDELSALDNQIGFVGVSGVPTLAGTNSEHFKLVQNGEVYELQLDTNLDDATLIAETDVLLTLQAQAEGAGVTDLGLATLVIKLPKKTAPVPFTSPYYEILYDISTDPHTLNPKYPIALTVGDYLAETTVDLVVPTEYEGLFDFNPDTYEITLPQNLDDTILNTQSEIVLTVVASLTGSTLQTSASVVIKLPEVPTPPKFSSASYTAKYDVVDATATVTLDGPITTDATDPAAVQITAEAPYATNFQIAYDEAQTAYTITVLVLLDQSILDTESEIYVTLDATVDRALDHSTTALVLKLPAKPENVVPKFSKIHYEADYQVGTAGPDTVTIPDTLPITIVSDHAVDTVVSVVETYAGNFEATFDGTTWQLTVVNPLDPSILNQGFPITVSLQASLAASLETGTATLIINLPNQTKKPAPKFSASYYNVEYQVAGDGTPTLVAGPINVDSTDVELVVVTVADFATTFVVAFDADNQLWNINLGDPLSPDVLEANTELAIQLTAHLDDSVDDDMAALIVKLPDKVQEVLAFDKAYYQATYNYDSAASDTVSAGQISVNIGASVVITDDSPHKDIFDIQCNGGTCALSLLGDLPEEVLTSETEIILVLEATKTGITEKGTATIVVALPLLDNLKAPEFSAAAYLATYSEDGTVTSTPIEIKGVIDVNQVTIELVGANKEYFTVVGNVDHWEITSSGLPQDVIDGSVSLLFTLQATNSDVTVPGLAALAIELPKKISASPFHFDKNVYMGAYDDNNQLVVADTITVEGDPDGTATFAITGDPSYSNLFQYLYNDDKTVTISLSGNLPQAVLDANAAISINIAATLPSETTPATATLIVTLPKTAGAAVPEFTEVAYTATYIVEGDTAQVTLSNGPIKIAGITDATTVDLVIEGDPTLTAYFDVVAEDDHWNLISSSVLPADVIDGSVAILLTLQATIPGVTVPGLAGLVIELPKKVSPSTFYFDKSVYTGNYDDNNQLVVANTITLEGDVDGAATIALSGDPSYIDFFLAVYNNDKTVTISLTGDLPQEVLDAKAAISINIAATLDSEATPATATLIVTLPKIASVAVPEFTQVAYTGTYTVEGGTAQIPLTNGPIQINGIEDATKADLVIADGPDTQYFDVEAEGDHWNLILKSELPLSTLSTEISLVLYLRATVNGVVGESGIVINLPKKVAPASFAFDSTVYQAVYDNSADPPRLVVGTAITLTGDATGVEVSVTGAFAAYFDAQITDATATISVIDPVPDAILNVLTFLTVDLVAATAEETATATVAVKLPDHTILPGLHFADTVYIADYELNDDGSPKFSVENDITLEGDSDNTALVSLIGGYSSNFDISYDNGKVTVTLKTPLSSDVLNNESAISLDIIATANGEDATVALVVKLPKTKKVVGSNSDSGADTGLIAAVSVLAVLLVASLVGSAVFYYLKFKRGSNYTNMEDPPRLSERFRKNSNNTDTKKFEHPTRRATGVIKYPLNDEVAGETTTDEMFGAAEKRKSVQFDTVNIDELEIEKPEDDVNDSEDHEYDTLDADESEERRSSRV